MAIAHRSPPVTIFQRLGFADRTALSQRIITNYSHHPDRAVLVPELIRSGILGPRHNGIDLAAVTPSDLSRSISHTVSENDLRSRFPDLNSPALFSSRSQLLANAESLLRSSSAGIASFARSRPVRLIAAGGLGSVAALGTTTALSNLGELSLGMGALLGAGYLGRHFESQLREDHWLKVPARIAAKSLPFAKFAATAGVAWLFHDSNFFLENVVQKIGFWGATGIASLGALSFGISLTNSLDRIRNAFGGQIDPNSLARMRRQMTGALFSISAQQFYLTTRLTLMGTSMAFILGHADNAMRAVLLGAPLLTYAATRFIRRHTAPTNNEHFNRFWDHAAIWAPVAGAVGSSGYALATSGMLGFVSSLTLWGAALTYFGEFHGIKHDINTAKGYITSLLASAKDLMGKTQVGNLLRETMPLDNGGVRTIIDRIRQVAIFNPHTGIREKSIGDLFTALLNACPNAVTISSYDRIPQTAVTNGPSDVRDLRAEKQFLESEVRGRQAELFSILLGGQIPAPTQANIQDCYSYLISNLRRAADYLDYQTLEHPQNPHNFLPTLRDFISSHREFFDIHTEEMLFAAFEQTRLRAKQFRNEANELERKLNSGNTSVNDFRREYENQLRNYDPDFCETLVIARKELAGDDWRVRKVENLASGMLFRGLTVYKAWRRENRNYPTADWISGTWTRVLNPFFRYDAAAGSMEASKYLWIEADQVLTPVQRENQEYLSTSEYVRRVDNTPAAGEGFARGGGTIEIPVARNTNYTETIRVGNYFYVDSRTGTAQTSMPSIKNVEMRSSLAQIITRISRNITEITAERNTWAQRERDYDQQLTRLNQEHPQLTSDLAQHQSDLQSVQSQGNRTRIAQLEQAIRNIRNDLQQNNAQRIAVANSLSEIRPYLQHVQGKLAEEESRLRSCEDAQNEILATGSRIIDQNSFSKHHEFATISGDRSNEDLISPSVFCIPLFEYTVMRDKNDIQVTSTVLEPAMVEREKENVFVNLMYRWPLGWPSRNSYRFTNPDPNRTVQSLSVVDANLELSYTDSDNQTHVIPYKISRADIQAQRGPEVNWQSLVSARITAGGELIFIYSELRNRQLGNYEVTIPYSAMPQYIGNLNLPQGQEAEIGVNNFNRNPRREGDTPFIRIAYTDGTAEFVRCLDGQRPILSNRGGNQYYNFTTSNGNQTVNINGISILRGKPVRLNAGWKAGLREGDRVADVNNSGQIYLENGNFSPTGQPQNRIANGSIIGRVIHQGGVNPSVINLGKYVNLDQVDHVERTIEIRPSHNQNRLQVIERRMDNQALNEDASAYIYTITPEGRRCIESQTPLRNITSVQIDQNRNIIVSYIRNDTNTAHQFTVMGEHVVDNFGHTLLNNVEGRVSELDHIYQPRQGHENDTETRRFNPRIDELDMGDDRLRLVVHKIDSHDIPLPAGTSMPSGDFTIFPSTARSAVCISGRWIPVNTRILRPNLIERGSNGFSEVFQGGIKSVVGPQTRFGNLGDMSAYLRDSYFYGLPVFSRFGRDGGHFGINRGKALRAQRGIQSGRTHTMIYKLTYAMYTATMMPTENQYYMKLSNYIDELHAAGVSEDTQFEVAQYFLGLRMHVLKEMTAIMPAEKILNKYEIQNTKRYNYSEEVFHLPFRIVMQDLVEGYSPFHQMEPHYFMSPAAMSEITAGRTWYKWALAKIAEITPIPFYLLSQEIVRSISRTFGIPENGQDAGGAISLLQSDLELYMPAMGVKMAASLYNYKQMLNSVGFNLLRDGLWRNVATEFSFMAGYLRGAATQFLYRNQHADFALTAGGQAGSVSSDAKCVIDALILVYGYSLGSSIYNTIKGGYDHQLSAPYGFGTAFNMGWGAYLFAVLVYARAILALESRRPVVQNRFTTRAQIREVLEVEPSHSISREIYDWFMRNILGSAPITHSIFNGLQGNDITGRVQRTDAVTDNIFNFLANNGYIDNNGNLLPSALSLRSASDLSLPPNFSNLRDQIFDVIQRRREHQHIDTTAYDAARQAVLGVGNPQNISYQQLFEHRENLIDLLGQINAVKGNGDLSFGLWHTWRNEANAIRETLTQTEMLITTRAINELRSGTATPSIALASLRTILRETREFIVRNDALKKYQEYIIGPGFAQFQQWGGAI